MKAIQSFPYKPHPFPPHPNPIPGDTLTPYPPARTPFTHSVLVSQATVLVSVHRLHMSGEGGERYDMPDLCPFLWRQVLSQGNVFSIVISIIRDLQEREKNNDKQASLPAKCWMSPLYPNCLCTWGESNSTSTPFHPIV